MHHMCSHNDIRCVLMQTLRWERPPLHTHTLVKSLRVTVQAPCIHRAVRKGKEQDFAAQTQVPTAGKQTTAVLLISSQEEGNQVRDERGGGVD